MKVYLVTTSECEWHNNEGAFLTLEEAKEGALQYVMSNAYQDYHGYDVLIEALEVGSISEYEVVGQVFGIAYSEYSKEDYATATPWLGPSSKADGSACHPGSLMVAKDAAEALSKWQAMKAVTG